LKQQGKVFLQKELVCVTVFTQACMYGVPADEEHGVVMKLSNLTFKGSFFSPSCQPDQAFLFLVAVSFQASCLMGAFLFRWGAFFFGGDWPRAFKQHAGARGGYSLSLVSLCLHLFLERQGLHKLHAWRRTTRSVESHYILSKWCLPCLRHFFMHAAPKLSRRMDWDAGFLFHHSAVGFFPLRSSQAQKRGMQA